MRILASRYYARLGERPIATGTWEGASNIARMVGGCWVKGSALREKSEWRRQSPSAIIQSNQILRNYLMGLILSDKPRCGSIQSTKSPRQALFSYNSPHQAPFCSIELHQAPSWPSSPPSPSSPSELCNLQTKQQRLESSPGLARHLLLLFKPRGSLFESRVGVRKLEIARDRACLVKSSVYHLLWTQ